MALIYYEYGNKIFDGASLVKVVSVIGVVEVASVIGVVDGKIEFGKSFAKL